MKYILRQVFIALFLLSGYNVYSQVLFGMNAKYATSNKMGMDFKLGYKPVIFNFGFTYPLKRGEIGTQMNTIGWRQFPEDHYEYGTYDDFFDLGIQFLVLKKIMIGTNLGLGSEVGFVNCYDRFEILGENGYYFMRRKTGNKKTNLSVNMDYLWHIKRSGIAISSGISWSKYYRLGFSLGYVAGFQ